MTITYIPQTVCWIKSNIPETHNGFIVDDHYTPAIVKGVVWVVKTIIVFICDNISQLDEVFILIAIIGVYLMMAGFRKWGNRLTVGSIWTYIACKVVADIAK